MTAFDFLIFSQSFCSVSPRTSIPYFIFYRVKDRYTLESSFNATDDRGKKLDFDRTMKQLRTEDVVVIPKGEKYYEVKRELEKKLSDQRNAGKGTGGKSNEKQQRATEQPKRAIDPTADVLATQRCEKAFREFMTGNVAEAKKLAKEAAEMNPRFWQAYSILAQAEENCERHKAAASYWKKVVELKGDDIEAITSYGQALYESGEYLDAARVFQTALSIARSSSDQKKMDDMTGCLGVCLIKGGKQETGHSFISQVLARDQTNVYCLTAYAHSLMCMAREGRGSKTEQFLNEALQVRVSNFSKDPNNKLLRKDLVESLLYDGGVQRMIRLLQADGIPHFLPGTPFSQQYTAYVKNNGAPTPNPGLSQAFDAISTVLKDAGVLDKSVHFRRCAFALDLKSAKAALELARAFELTGDYASALTTARLFFALNGTQLGTVSSKAMDSILETIHPEGWKAKRPTLEDVRAQCASASGTEDVLLCDQRDSKPHKFSEDECHHLGLGMLAVRVLFCSGMIAAARELAALLCPLCGVEDFSKSDIKDESAAFSFVCKLLNEVKLASVAEPNAKPLYAIGGLHSLSCSWQTMDAKGTTYVIIPVPIFGLQLCSTKAWDKSYTAKHFDATVDTLPSDAPVILAIGDFDCDAGITDSVRKAEHENVSEAISTATATYVQTLKRLRKEKQFSIFVHPVLQTQASKKDVVNRFDSSLEIAVKKVSASDSQVHYLNICEQFNTESASKDLMLDDSHISPNYVKTVLEKEFERLQ